MTTNRDGSNEQGDFYLPTWVDEGSTEGTQSGIFLIDESGPSLDSDRNVEITEPAIDKPSAESIPLFERLSATEELKTVYRDIKESFFAESSEWRKRSVDDVSKMDQNEWVLSFAGHVKPANPDDKRSASSVLKSNLTQLFDMALELAEETGDVDYLEDATTTSKIYADLQGLSQTSSEMTFYTSRLAASEAMTGDSARSRATLHRIRDQLRDELEVAVRDAESKPDLFGGSRIIEKREKYSIRSYHVAHALARIGAFEDALGVMKDTDKVFAELDKESQSKPKVSNSRDDARLELWTKIVNSGNKSDRYSLDVFYGHLEAMSDEDMKRKLAFTMVGYIDDPWNSGFVRGVVREHIESIDPESPLHAARWVELFKTVPTPIILGHAVEMIAGDRSQLPADIKGIALLEIISKSEADLTRMSHHSRDHLQTVILRVVDDINNYEFAGIPLEAASPEALQKVFNRLTKRLGAITTGRASELSVERDLKASAKKRRPARAIGMRPRLLMAAARLSELGQRRRELEEEYNISAIYDLTLFDEDFPQEKDEAQLNFAMDEVAYLASHDSAIKAARRLGEIFNRGFKDVSKLNHKLVPIVIGSLIARGNKEDLEKLFKRVYPNIDNLNIHQKLEFVKNVEDHAEVTRSQLILDTTSE